MPEKGLPLLTEYRHWRASLPVGAFMLFTGYLLIVRAWPELVERPESVYAQGVMRLGWLASPTAIWILLTAFSLMIGTWWGEVCSSIIALLQWGALVKLPLQDSVSGWTAWQRALLPFRISEMSHVQDMMRASPDYADLRESDQRKAYVGFLKEVLWNPCLSLGEVATGEAELVRSVTNMRLSAGLLPWLPLSVLGIAANMTTPPDGFGFWLWTGVVALSASLLMSVTRQSRDGSSLAIRMACAPERLAHHARNAQAK